MEKDIDRIAKNPDTEIVIRVDDFGGRRGVTIREFVKSERYTGFTKAGTRIPADKFALFKQAINAIDDKELLEAISGEVKEGAQQELGGEKMKSSGKKKSEKVQGIDEQAM
jgi:hypothetical protein